MTHGCGQAAQCVSRIFQLAMSNNLRSTFRPQNEVSFRKLQQRREMHSLKSRASVDIQMGAAEGASIEATAADRAHPQARSSASTLSRASSSTKQRRSPDSSNAGIELPLANTFNKQLAVESIFVPPSRDADSRFV
jgi:hypothetical protein